MIVVSVFFEFDSLTSEIVVVEVIESSGVVTSTLFPSVVVMFEVFVATLSAPISSLGGVVSVTVSATTSYSVDGLGIIF